MAAFDVLIAGAGPAGAAAARTLASVAPDLRVAVVAPVEQPRCRGEVLSPLGTGTFGSVWRVRDLSLEREVALKMLHPQVARDDAAVARFRREAQLAAQLAHPAIVPIYDWDRRGPVAWYTMELAEGGSVADLVVRSGPRPLAEIGPQVDLILDGLSAAHASGRTTGACG